MLLLGYDAAIDGNIPCVEEKEDLDSFIYKFLFLEGGISGIC